MGVRFCSPEDHKHQLWLLSLKSDMGSHSKIYYDEFEARREFEAEEKRGSKAYLFALMSRDEKQADRDKALEQLNAALKYSSVSIIKKAIREAIDYLKIRCGEGYAIVPKVPTEEMIDAVEPNRPADFRSVSEAECCELQRKMIKTNYQKMIFKGMRKP